MKDVLIYNPHASKGARHFREKKIMEAFSGRKECDYFCQLVSYEEIVEQNYNLSVSTYVEQKDTREVIDIKSVNTRLDEIVCYEEELRQAINRIVSQIKMYTEE